MKKKTMLSWSSGKDSAWALHVLRRDPAIEVFGLFSVLNGQSDRLPMHSTRSELLRRQAAAAGLPLKTINLPEHGTKEQRDAIMGNFIAQISTAKTECIAFGDLFLSDLRQYRENQMAGTGIAPIFPLWQIPTAELAEQMLTAGLEAYISSVDLKKLPVRFVGRRWSFDLLREFPAGVDPCGEYGEIHTIVVNGPMFKKRIDIEIGEVVQQNGFAYADIIPVN